MLFSLTGWVQGAFLPSRASKRRGGFGERLELLEPRQLLTVTLNPITANDLPAGKVEYVPLTASDDTQSPISFSVQSSDPSVTSEVVTGGRSLKLNISGVDATSQPFTGDLTFRLFEDLAPTTTSRIINLVNSGFYNGLIFHRVIGSFVAQGGDPTGTGTGGSGVTLDDEFNKGLTFTSTGLLAMANAGDDTGDSQFFITDTELPLSALPQHLNFQHSIFGILTSGFDTFKKLINTPTDASNRPTNNETINSAQVFTDTQNGVARISAPEGFVGSAGITVTATDTLGGNAVRSFNANVVADTVNDRAFLGTVTNQTTTTGTPVTFNVQGTDLENDALTFVVKDPTVFSESVTDAPPQNVTASIVVTQGTATTPTSAAITLTPAVGFNGTINLLLGVRDQTNRSVLSNGTAGPVDAKSNFDTQKFTLTVNPPSNAPASPAALALDSASDDGSSHSDGVTSVSTPVVTATATPGSTVQFLVNGTSTVPATETSSGQYSATLTRQMLQVGANSITATATSGGSTSVPSAPLSITYTPSFANLYTVPGAFGSAQQVTFTWSSRQAAFNNELGVYAVDDLQGRVNGLLPGDAGYAAAALNSSTRQILFDSGSGAGATKTISATGGQLLGYYLISNNTTAHFLSLNPTNALTGLNAFFSYKAANPDGFAHMGATTDSVTGKAQLNWEDLLFGGDRDLNDAVINVAPTASAASFAANVLRIPGSASSSVQTTFSLETALRAAGSADGAPHAAIQGELGLFIVDDNSGTIGGVAPGASNYAQTALSSAKRQVIFNSGDPLNTSRPLQITGGSLVAYYYIPGGTAASVLASNSANSATGSPVALFSLDAANPDASNHFRWFGPEGRPSDSADDTSLHLHISDKLSGNDADFDAFKVGIKFAS